MLASLRFRRNRERLYTWLLAAGGLLLAIGAGFLAEDYGHRVAQEAFRREVAPRAAAIEASIARDVQMVRSLAAFMSSRENVTSTEFRAFVDMMRADAAGIQAMQWMPRVTDEQRAAFEQSAREEIPGYRVLPEAPPGERIEMLGPSSFPARFVEPLLGNESLLGRDATADTAVAAALSRALVQHDVTASGRLALVTPFQGDKGVLLVSPVFDAGGGLRGFVGALLRIDVVMEMTIARLPVVGLDIHVTDPQAGGADLHAFSDRQAAGGAFASVTVAPRPSASAPVMGASHEIGVADRVWRIDLYPSEGYRPPAKPVSPAIAAIAVLLLTGVIILQWMLMQKRAQLLARASLSDGLTGLANRTHCERVLNAEWERAIRYGKRLAILVVDIDQFSDYNARFGPFSGDECLRRIATALSRVSVRASDLTCRYAGDRFMLILPETDHEGAHYLGTCTRQAVRDLRIPHPGHAPDPVVTVTVVVASARPKRGDRLAPLVTAAIDLLDSPERGTGDAILDLPASTA